MLRRRIAALEHDDGNLGEMMVPLLRHSWHATFSPKLWQRVQYEPRAAVELTATIAETSLLPSAPHIAIITPSYNYAEFIGETARA
jgi:hypothetical protein